MLENTYASTNFISEKLFGLDYGLLNKVYTQNREIISGYGYRWESDYKRQRIVSMLV
jgi:hypothetical protein